MQALFIFLTLVAPSPSSTQSGATPVLDDSPIPLPLGSTRPRDGGYYFIAGSRIGRGIGWQASDASAVEVAGNGVTYRRPLWETETYRLSAFAGSDFGMSQEWYLGNGVCTVIDFGLGASKFGVVWYPTEYMTLSIYLDPLRGQLTWRWTLPPMPPLSKADAELIKTLATELFWDPLRAARCLYGFFSSP